MNRQDLENSINVIDFLLETDSPEEREYQKWFETYKVVFDLLGFKKIIPHPRLENNDQVLIPDFLVQGIDDIWSIFEIKRPDTDLLKRRSRRKEFYSSFREYISQCHEYNEFYDDKANRDSFNLKNGTSIHKSLKSYIVAGRNANLDKTEIQKILFREGGKIELKTYDDIRNYLEYHRRKTYGQYDGITGITAGAVLNIKKLEGKNNFIVDFGTNPLKNRISIFVNNTHQLCLRVLDKNNKEYTTKIQEGSSGFHYDKLFFMYFTLGITKDSTIISLEINGEHFRDIFVDSIKFNSPFILCTHPLNRYINLLFGTDINFTEESRFGLGSSFLYQIRQNFEDRSQVRKFLAHEMSNTIKTVPFGKEGCRYASTVTNLIFPERKNYINGHHIIQVKHV